MDLNEQEQLILAAYNISIACTNLTSYISSAVAAIPDLTTSGIFKGYIGGEKDLNFYAVKAQEMQTLSEVIHQFSLDTYSEMINVDTVLSLEINNMILSTSIPRTSSVGQEDKDTLAQAQNNIRTDPQTNFEHFKNPDNRS